MRLVGHGHPHVRATHDKTFELSADETITARATCVLGVGPLESDGPMTALAGPVRITVRAGSASAVVTAVANSAWDPTAGLVVRRGSLRLPGTFAVEADTAAVDLPRALVEAMREPGPVEWDVEPAPSPSSWIVLFAADPTVGARPQLRAELAAADVVVAEDDGACRVIAAVDPDVAVVAPALFDAAGGRTLVVSSTGLPGAALDPATFAAARLDVLGLPPPLAAAAASPSRASVLLPAGARPVDVLRSAPVAARVVVSVERADVPTLIADAGRLRGSSSAVAVEPYGSPVRLDGGEVPRFSSSPVSVCFDAQAESTALDPRVDAAVQALLADGTPTRTVARAVAELTGWPRRTAYDLVIRRRPTSGQR